MNFNYAPKIPAKRIAELQNDDKIYLDLSFQSEERWNDTQRRKYVKSLYLILAQHQ